MKKIIAAVLAMFTGGMLYLLTRNESLVLFDWVNALGLGTGVRSLRGLAGPSLAGLPAWLYLSLPQALWYLSGLLAFHAIWGSGPTGHRHCSSAWLASFSALAFGMELGQAVHWVPGRFDRVDLGLLFVAAGVAASTVAFERRGRSRLAPEVLR